MASEYDCEDALASAPEQRGKQKEGLPEGSDQQAEIQSLPGFGTAEYWEQEYKELRHPAIVACGGSNPDSTVDPSSYDWLAEWHDLGWLICNDILSHSFDKRILHLGNGTSSMPEDLYKLGFSTGRYAQVATDVSGSCVACMRAKYEAAHIPQDSLHFVLADACDLLVPVGSGCARAAMECHEDLLKPDYDRCHDDAEMRKTIFADARYDLVFEKSTLDALQCHDDRHALMILGLLKEAHRVLKPDGVFLSVSIYPPPILSCYLNLRCFGWRISCFPLLDDSRSSLDDTILDEGGSGSASGLLASGVVSKSPDADPVPHDHSLELERLKRRYLILKAASVAAREEEGGSIPPTAANGAGGSCSAGGPSRPRRRTFHYCYICTSKSDEAMAKFWPETYAAVSAAPGEDPGKALLADTDISW
eukprot:CAMPEP_0204584422 /NCGR_PEP_ID=MMETSP0661-20131031/46326_1 /ASSEMBLY_ACC=CAM_ASM_000606 /TAXON_ID=109239 /ORGANISM="Alexandrium margalefi, Strain AMGDE01CS-322" /LENGTH=419 /DNA_ID=CAMNT_0051593863 /DNA_START=63 /DNA_END=1319 /DNA_ORIENTATION=-